MHGRCEYPYGLLHTVIGRSQLKSCIKGLKVAAKLVFETFDGIGVSRYSIWHGIHSNNTV